MRVNTAEKRRLLRAGPGTLSFALVLLFTHAAFGQSGSQPDLTAPGLLPPMVNYAQRLRTVRQWEIAVPMVGFPICAGTFVSVFVVGAGGDGDLAGWLSGATILAVLGTVLGTVAIGTHEGTLSNRLQSYRLSIAPLVTPGGAAIQATVRF